MTSSDFNLYPYIFAVTRFHVLPACVSAQLLPSGCPPCSIPLLLKMYSLSLLISAWHRWHCYGQFTLERGRLICACGSLMLLSMHSLCIAVRCAVHGDLCVCFFSFLYMLWAKGSATAARHGDSMLLFSTWVFSTCCLVVQAVLVRITYHVALWQLETEPLFDFLAVRQHLIYSSSSPCVLSVRMGHGLSPFQQRKSVSNSKGSVTFKFKYCKSRHN